MTMSTNERAHCLRPRQTLLSSALFALLVCGSLLAQTTDQDRVTIYNLRKSCADEARKWLKSSSFQSAPNDLYYNYKIHYSVKLNGCFVLQSDTIYDDKKYNGHSTVPYQRRVMVADIHSDESVAYYWASYSDDSGLFLHDCRLPPDGKAYCKIHGKVSDAPRDDNDNDITKEWSDAIKPYMDE
jgi:hypothetical protein